MSTIPAIQSAYTGIQSGMQKLNENSAQIAKATTTGSDVNLSEPLVELMLNEQQVKASAKVIEANDDILGSILNIKV